jgi:hypothetical protein
MNLHNEPQSETTSKNVLQNLTKKNLPPKQAPSPLNLNTPNSYTNKEGDFYYYIKRHENGRQSVYRLREGISYDLDKLPPPPTMKLGKYFFPVSL